MALLSSWTVYHRCWRFKPAYAIGAILNGDGGLLMSGSLGAPGTPATETQMINMFTARTVVNPSGDMSYSRAYLDGI